MDLFLQLVLTMNHTCWFETRRQIIYLVIYAEEFILNLIWITEASIQQLNPCMKNPLQLRFINLNGHACRFRSWSQIWHFLKDAETPPSSRRWMFCSNYLTWNLDLILQLVLTMNHIGWFERLGQMIDLVIYAEKSLINLIWITEASIQQLPIISCHSLLTTPITH